MSNSGWNFAGGFSLGTVTVTVEPSGVDAGNISVTVRGVGIPIGAVRASYNPITGDWTATGGLGYNLSLSGINFEFYGGLGFSDDGIVFSGLLQGKFGPATLFQYGTQKGAVTRLGGQFEHLIISWEDLILTQEEMIDLPAISDLGLQSCFPSGTPISLPDGTSLPIEQVAPAKHVSAFASKEQAVSAPLEARPVVRLFNNITEEWITLVWRDPASEEPRLLTATPGHVMLKPDGGFVQLAEMIDASVVPLTAARVPEDGALKSRAA